VYARAAWRGHQGEAVDKETKKGLGILAVIVAAIGLLFWFASGTENKAGCIAAALKSKMEVANIDKHCGLTKRN
jgi:hypothetical protein